MTAVQAPTERIHERHSHEERRSHDYLNDAIMPYDKELAERIRHVFRERSDVTERKMFGGLAFLSAGRMCCGILGGDLIVRIADDEFQAVMRRPQVCLMDFTGKPLKGFVYVSPQSGAVAWNASICTQLINGFHLGKIWAIISKSLILND